MRFRFIYALVAALSACMLLVGAAVAIGAPGNGNGSNSTATSGPGSSAQGCDGTHHSDTGNGANQGTVYDNTCDGSASGNGNGGGQATGKPCAGCVGNADDKNPNGQMPDASDHNRGYECDTNHGIARTNPAHTGCQVTTTENPPPTCPNGQPIPPSGKCETGGGETCPNGQPKPPSGDCGAGNHGQTCPNGQPMPETGNCGGGNETPTTPTTPATPTSTNTPETPQQAVLGERQTSPESTTAPANTTSPKQAVLGESGGGTTPAASPPAAAQQARAANANRSTLPFTGTDGIAVLLAGALMLLAGFGLRRLAAHRA